MHALEGSPSSPPEAFCRRILPAVSRTFALNIPVLPAPLDLVVTVAYLLCRIADTLEDEAEGPVQRRRALLSTFAELVALPGGWEPQAQAFTTRATEVLRPQAPPAEVELVAGTPVVLECLAGLPPWTRPHMVRCVRVMAEGMAQVADETARHGADGLPDLQSTLRYCYFVAGVVGEMLTGLFVGYAPEAARQKEDLEARAAAFGRALQLTNILKDIREDLERGSCWLPRDRMAAHGVSARTLLQPEARSRAVALLNELIGVAKREADVAFEYSLLLPQEPPGLRLFCLWPLFFAVRTLATLKDNPAVFEPGSVKISRDAVQAIIVATQEHVASDARLASLYAEHSGAL